MPHRRRSRRRGPDRRDGTARAAGPLPPGRSSWRRTALTPRQGAAEACASCPCTRRRIATRRGTGPAGAPVAGVDHHGGVDAGKGPTLEEHDLAAPELLRRRAHDAHREAHVVCHPRQGNARPHGARGDDVVAAGVPDLGEQACSGRSGDDEVAAAPCVRRTPSRGRRRPPSRRNPHPTAPRPSTGTSGAPRRRSRDVRGCGGSGR